MRVFAGPNGSGKSTLVNQFIKEKSKLINPDCHINPDYLNSINVLDFSKFRLKVNEIENDDYIFLNGRVSFPVKFLEQLVKKIKPNDAVKSDDTLIAAKVKKDDIIKFKKIICNQKRSENDF